MSKEKIGKDVIDKRKGMSAKESKEFEEWRLKQEAEKRKKKAKKPKAEEIEGKRLVLKPPEEREPSAEKLAEEKAKAIAEMHRLKEEGKSVHVSEHFRRPPNEAKAETEKAETAEEEEEEEKDQRR